MANYSSDTLAGATLLGTKFVTLPAVQDTPGEPDYGDPVCEAPTGTSGDLPRLSRIFTHMTDLTINCPILKSHSTSGITAAMKNIYGIINNPGQFHNTCHRPAQALRRAGHPRLDFFHHRRRADRCHHSRHHEFRRRRTQAKFSWDWTQWHSTATP